ncbi:MAG: cache domain-containing protein [Burkholderiaceae bacterium]
MKLVRGFRALSIRHKLLVLGIGPLLLALPLLALILLVWGDSALDAMLVAKVRSDLAVARGYFERVEAEVGASTLAVAGSLALYDVVARNDEQALKQLIARAKQQHALEFLVYRPGPPPPLPERPARDGSEGIASVAILDAKQLDALAPDLDGRIGIDLVNTQAAKPSERQREERAMVMTAAAPVLSPGGRLLGHLRGGVLLNRNLAFIDHINEIVYPQGALPFGSQGTATLFLDDVRITTNVRLFGAVGSERAIGTRVSQAVHDAVLERGETWLGRAFVVSDWYVSGYLPLADAAGQRVGMLYVGFLEKPFQAIKLGVVYGMGGVVLALMALSLWLALGWARRIFEPIDAMTRTMRAVESGDLAARTGLTGSSDEVGQLAGHLDRLLDTIDDKTRALQQAHDVLDQKVIERTRELASAQAQLIRSEKLAAIGQLTAGIAHEVNNPIAVIQGNLDLVREMLGKKANPVRSELKLIDAQIERMRLIVTQLLQFARPTEFAGYAEAVDPARAIDDSLVLVQHLLSRTAIAIERDFRATRSAHINRQELQQVLINLIVNAIQVMPGGGTLRLATRDVGEAQVAIDIVDTGPGFAAAVERNLFQAFVTTKKEGTGLGLWISRNLVERYGGDIQARNRDDGVAGAVLTVQLPTEATPEVPAGA